ncbi:PH domain-containing protein [Microbacterium karelineae]|uniref:PH domain-containing protein n=1 Tax=Microbacterium karelineae TaxID=2654283 RepID=UPI0012EB052A|nr:PH domain-containing protein [Microbacterium karelineae]
MPDSARTLVFRSVIGWVWLGIAAIVCAYLLIDMAVRAGAWDAFLVAPWLLAIVWVVWVFQVIPRVEADEDGARLFNVLRIVELPWSAVAGVRLRYSAEFTLHDGARITAWGGSSRRMHRSLKRASEDPAEVEVEQLQRLHANAAGGSGTATRRWDVRAVVAGIAIVVWIAFSLIQTGGFSFGV